MFALKIILILVFITPDLNSALECYCNECNDGDSCETSTHAHSVCFKSVKRELENNTFIRIIRYGCLSGADDSLSTAQCSINTRAHMEPIFISCCNDVDRCNLDIPDPDGRDDPRWLDEFTEVPQYLQYPSLWLIAITTVIIVTMIIIALIIKIRRNSKSSDKDYVERLKKHIAVSNSTISDYWSNKSESPSYFPDSTSGRGRDLIVRELAAQIRSKSMIPLGNGRHGRVFLAQLNLNKVAVKAFRSIDAPSWRREEAILRKVNHENVIRWIASETVDSDHGIETWMVIEFCPFGSLHDFLDSYEMSSQHALKLVHSIIQGISYLHGDLGKPPIAHRDIKSRNILMRTPEICCIADFGHSIYLDGKTIEFGDNERVRVGTIRYMAPEILQAENLDTTDFSTFAQSDVYQFALVVWEIAQRTTGPHQLPYDGVVTQNPDLEDMIKIVCELNYRPPILQCWQEDPILEKLATLMGECWRKCPQARFGTSQVLKRVLALYDSMLYKNLINHYSPILGLDKTPSSGGEKTQTTIDMF